jgi:hypothetical protein
LLQVLLAVRRKIVGAPDGGGVLAAKMKSKRFTFFISLARGCVLCVGKARSPREKENDDDAARVRACADTKKTSVSETKGVRFHA